MAAESRESCPACGGPIRRDNRDPDRVCGYCQVGIDRNARRPVPHLLDKVREIRAARPELSADGPIVEPPAPLGGDRPMTIWRKEVRRQALAARLVPGMRQALLEAELQRPKIREHCRDGERPCPWLSCRWHLYLEITPAGGIKLNHPGKDLEELEETCALDVAERGGATLEKVGELLGLTRERIRQLETYALEAARRRQPIAQVLDLEKPEE